MSAISPLSHAAPLYPQHEEKPAVQEAPLFQKPCLPAPLQLIARVNHITSVGDDWLKLHMQLLNQEYAKMDQLRMEKALQMKESINRSLAGETWDLLKRIGTYILAAISTVIGISLLGTGGGTLIGGAMIGSGILSLANLALTDAGAWDWIAEHLSKENEDAQALLATLLPGAVGILAAIGSAATLAGAWSSLNAFPQMLTIAQTALSFTQGINEFGKASAQASVLWTDSKCLGVEKELVLSQKRLDHLSRGLKNFIAHQRSTRDQAFEMMKLSQRPTQLLLRG